MNTVPLHGSYWIRVGGIFFLERGRVVCRLGSGWPLLSFTATSTRTR